jgi:glycine/D-amino acid oxidase-like deaminating enzyme
VAAAAQYVADADAVVGGAKRALRKERHRAHPGGDLNLTGLAIAPQQTELEQRYRSRSLWLDGVPEPLTPRPSLPGDLSCDAVVVGGGFTGLWTAYYLKSLQPDLRVVLLEAEIAGFGPSGRNGGWASVGIAGQARVYEEAAGIDSVRRATRETLNAVDEIGAVAEREGIDCGFAKKGMVRVATSAPQDERVRESVEEHRHTGMEDIRLLSAAELEQEFVKVRGARSAWHVPGSARIDPGRLARGLAHACERLGVTIHERTRALEVGPREVRCEAGTVRADLVLRATESYSTLLRGGARGYLPMYSLMIATEPLADSVWEEIGWEDGLLVGDQHQLFFYAQRTTDGRIAIGGRGAPYRLGHALDEGNERNDEVRERLQRALHECFPPVADAEITHHWGGPLAAPRDWSMAVHFDPASGFGWAGGYTGHGVVASNISGRTLADLALGRDTDLVTLPWVGHRSPRWEPEPLRYLASLAIVRILGSADRVEDRTDRPARRTRAVSRFLPPR